MIDKAILNKSRLEEIRKTTPVKSFGSFQIDKQEFIYYYCDKQVAKVIFEGNDVKVAVIKVFNPWSYIVNDNYQYFARIHRVEDQLHGVDVISTDIPQALFVEFSVNKTKTVDDENMAVKWARLFMKETETLNSMVRLNNLKMRSKTSQK